MSAVHSFADSLAKSNTYADAPWWAEVYRKAFPGFDVMQCMRSDGWAQRAGIDRRIHLNSGKTIEVDEKVRERDWPDFLLERWSDEGRRTPGWIQKDLRCDFIAYAFVPSRVCHLLPFPLLRRAWTKHGRAWAQRHETVRARNNGYVTASVAVPIGEVYAALSGAMAVTWVAPPQPVTAA